MPSTPLIDEIENRLNRSSRLSSRIFWQRKKLFWIVFIQGAESLKRALDFLVALLMLIVLSPLMLLIAMIIKCDGGPVLYTTQRVGKWGKEFLFPKFRTMIPGADKQKIDLIALNQHAGDTTFKMKNDPRITSFGRILRKLSLDELPQLWCVLKGEMSLVGPRPPLPEEVATYTLKERSRLDVKPGLTCFWQTEGRSNLPFPKQVELDKQYIESQSFWLDLKLIAKTIPAVLFGKGAY